MGMEETYILIATDCISEVQNLQDCDYIINYDNNNKIFIIHFPIREIFFLLFCHVINIS